MVSRGDSAEVFEFAEELLDLIPLPVMFPGQYQRLESVRSCIDVRQGLHEPAWSGTAYGNHLRLLIAENDSSLNKLVHIHTATTASGLTSHSSLSGKPIH
jgi:hypothetical protein